MSPPMWLHGLILLCVTMPALLEIALVILFRPVELRRGRDLRHDRPLVSAAHFELLLHRLRRHHLLGGVIEHRGPVLRPEVRPLPVQGRGVVIFKKHSQELFVRDLGGIELHLQGFGVPGFSRAHVFIGRFLERSARVADRRPRHPLDLAKHGLDPPETPCGECGPLHGSLCLPYLLASLRPSMSCRAWRSKKALSSPYSKAFSRFHLNAHGGTVVLNGAWGMCPPWGKRRS